MCDIYYFTVQASTRVTVKVRIIVTQNACRSEKKLIYFFINICASTSTWKINSDLEEGLVQVRSLSRRNPYHKFHIFNRSTLNDTRSGKCHFEFLLVKNYFWCCNSCEIFAATSVCSKIITTRFQCTCLFAYETFGYAWVSLEFSS